ncbi:MAG: hypothetical protein LUE89_00055 [Clostridiales bacterium]|nr:hypothetical protein [Clostridiales bacterium]
MRECKIYITATHAADATGKTITAASGTGTDIIAAIADALVCMIEQTKLEDATTDRLAHQAINIAVRRREHAKITAVRQACKQEKMEEMS